MLKFKFGFFVLGLVLGIALLANPSSAQAQCGGSYYAPSYGYSNYYRPSYGYNRSYYGGGYYNAGRSRLRRTVAVAAVVGAAIALSDNDNFRRRSRRF